MYQASDVASTSTAYVRGSTKVTSPLARPFYIVPGFGNSGWTVQWDAAISSDDEDAAVMVGAQDVATFGNNLTGFTNCNSTVIFAGDNSGFKGSIIANGPRATFKFTSAIALGGSSGTFNPKGLVIQNGVTVSPTETGIVLPADMSRGIYVAESGGKLNVPANMDLTVACPVSGPGILIKTGAGTLLVESTWQPEEGDLANLAVTEGCVAAPVGKTEVLDGLTFTGGAVGISYDATSGTSGVLELGANCTISWPLKVQPLATRGLQHIPFLKVPTSYGEITVQNFVPNGNLAALGLPSQAYEVERSGDFYVVSVSTSTIVTQKSGAANISCGNNDYDCWSDGLEFHANADYQVVSESKYRTYYVKPKEVDYVFPSGTSLTVNNRGGSEAQMIWLYYKSLTADLRLGDRTKIQLSDLDASKTFTLMGSVYLCGVNTQTDTATDWRVNDATLILKAKMSGPGRMSIQTSKSSCPGTVILAGDNDFTGNIWTYSTSSSSPLTIGFSDPTNLGATPNSLQKEGFLLNARVTLHPTKSVCINQPNRGFYVRNSCNVRVDDGNVFDLRSPMYFCKGTVTSKLGTGVWALGGTTALGDDKVSDAVPEISVGEGYVRADNPRAFSVVKLTFADGTGVAAKYRPGETTDVATYGMIVSEASKFSVSGGTLALRADAEGQKVNSSTRIPVMTVVPAVASTLDAKNIRIDSDVVGREAILVRDNVTIDGESYVRYSAGFERGMAIILR